MKMLEPKLNVYSTETDPCDIHLLSVRTLCLKLCKNIGFIYAID